MMPEMAQEWLELWIDGGETCFIALHEEGTIDASVEEFISSNGTRDKLLHLDGWVGGTVCILASAIWGWVLSTKDLRRATLEQQWAADQQMAEVRAELGIFE